MFVSAIIVAGGRGTRVGGDVPKQMLEIAGQTMLQRSVKAFDAHPAVNQIVVVLPNGLTQSFPFDCENEPEFVAGGERRQDSVASGFSAVNPSADIVLVHDAARPFVSGDLISRVIASAAEHGAAVPARAASDTVKRAMKAGAPVLETIPRETVWLAQTPQGFRRAVLADAIAQAAQTEVTDEAMAAERAGHAVHIVEGDEQNVKITTREDLERARAKFFPDDYSRLNEPGIIIREEFRVGTGYDLHRLVEGRPLVLAGIEIPFDKGPLGHSDGDVVSHALCDALFGAAAMGDIGRHFPDTDPKWKNVPGPDFLRWTREILGKAGWRVTSVDVTVVLEKPKLSPFMPAIVEAVGKMLNTNAVSIKAKTNEGVDAVGRGEAIAAHAVAVISREVQS